MCKIVVKNVLESSVTYSYALLGRNVYILVVLQIIQQCFVGSSNGYILQPYV